jgi:tetratricopeptide (TPR) repeat protein
MPTANSTTRRNYALAVLFCMAIALVPFALDFIGALQRSSVDPQCLTARRPVAVHVEDAKTAEEYLSRGDEAFDGGNYEEAFAAYTQALDLNPNYAEAYNNRAYTYMRMQNYAPALKDLDQALRIRPDYMNALMNRGDIHNYYYAQDRKKAIDDYDHILRLGGQAKKASVCGHRAVAIFNLPGHEGWNVVSWFKLVRRSQQEVCQMKAS